MRDQQPEQTDRESSGKQPVATEMEARFGRTAQNILIAGLLATAYVYLRPA